MRQFLRRLEELSAVDPCGVAATRQCLRCWRNRLLSVFVTWELPDDYYAIILLAVSAISSAAIVCLKKKRLYEQQIEQLNAFVSRLQDQVLCNCIVSFFGMKFFFKKTSVKHPDQM